MDDFSTIFPDFSSFYFTWKRFNIVFSTDFLYIFLVTDHMSVTTYACHMIITWSRTFHFGSCTAFAQHLTALHSLVQHCGFSSLESTALYSIAQPQHSHTPRFMYSIAQHLYSICTATQCAFCTAFLCTANFLFHLFNFFYLFPTLLYPCKHVQIRPSP